MHPTVTLTITEGQCKGAEWTFHEPIHCILGRSRGCYPQLDGGPENWTVSRFHCLLNIDPPRVRVRDIGSRNGTFVNGQNIGQRDEAQSPADIPGLIYPEHELHDGDELRIGGTAFRVQVEGAETAPDQTEHLDPLLLETAY
jgi:predicted component of type VI protein secretion system